MVIPIYTGDYPTDDFIDDLFYKGAISGFGQEKLKKDFLDGKFENTFQMRVGKLQENQVSQVVEVMKEVNGD